MRLRWATAAPCLPSAVRVLAGMLAIDRFFWAPARCAATLRLAALTCFSVAMVHLPVSAGCVPQDGQVTPAWAPGVQRRSPLLRRAGPAPMPVSPSDQPCRSPSAVLSALEHRLEGGVEVAVSAVGVGVALVGLGVGDVLVGLVGGEGGHGVATLLCTPEPTAARMAAPVAVVSTLVGTRTGRPVTSALIWRQRALAPPPTIVRRRTSGPAAPHPLEDVAERRTLPSSRARIMWALVWASEAVGDPRAAPFHSGAIAPCIRGRKTSPSAPGGTLAAGPVSRS